MRRINFVAIVIASTLGVAGSASAEPVDQIPMTSIEAGQQSCADKSSMVIAAAEKEQAPAEKEQPPSGDVQERAIPSTGTCSITTYYSDAAMTHQVGTFSTCPGPKRGLTGRRTSYYDVDTVNLGNTGPDIRRDPAAYRANFFKKAAAICPDRATETLAG
jgi:hypothetical protein